MTPRTEAGKRLLDGLDESMFALGDWRKAILAIEAEASLSPDRDEGLRAAVEWAISALEHTSDRHATDALLKLRAALASDGETT